MAQTVNINGSSNYEIEQKAKVLQDISDKLSLKEIEKLGKIANSTKAKSYLNGAKYMMLKNFLNL